MQIKMAAYFDLLGDLPINSATIFIIIGVVVTIISFFGCCGAIMENACMMYTFASLVTLMLLIEVGLTVVILIYKDETKQEIKKQLKNGLDNYNKTSAHGGIDLTWDTMQQSYECCGIENPGDWGNADEFSKKYPNSVPDSCCKEKAPKCGINMLKNTELIYTDGCFQKFATDVEEKVWISGTVGGILGAIQLIAILVACCMGRKMANRPYDDYEHSPSAPLYANY
jgi:hypothetical protein